MAVQRLAYLTALGLCWIFYLAWGQWLHWVLLWAVLVLPWISLLVSLGAILRFRTEPGGADAFAQGERGELCLLGSCSLPVPPFRGRLRLTNLRTGEQQLYKLDKGLPTRHCGGYRVSVERARVCDYLGLFAFPVRCREEKCIVIRPAPVPIPALEHLQSGIPRQLQPSPGPSELRELRPYRPGDSLKQIHWKLSAKTGSLLLHQGMAPPRLEALVTMNLRGDAPRFDRKCGQLRWLGERLLQCQIPFSLEVLTGAGIVSARIATREALEAALDRLLRCPATRQGDIRELTAAAPWHCHIGGNADG